MTDNASPKTDDERLSDYRDRDDVRVLMDGSANWEAKKGGEIIDRGRAIPHE